MSDIAVRDCRFGYRTNHKYEQITNKDITEDNEIIKNCIKQRFGYGTNCGGGGKLSSATKAEVEPQEREREREGEGEGE